MANINISEISQNYTYAIGTNSYACVAMPITACWGPSLNLAEYSEDQSIDDFLEQVKWQRFPATQEGLESFVSTYRGATSVYRLAQDYSYQMAMTLISAGYDLLTCRISTGVRAQGKLAIGQFAYGVSAKYEGTFGNNLRVIAKQVTNRDYYQVITYVIDSSGIKTAVENLTLTTDMSKATDSILYIGEIESNFIEFSDLSTAVTNEKSDIVLSGGSDAPKGETDTAQAYMTTAVQFAESRFKMVYTDIGDATSGGDGKTARFDYLKELDHVKSTADQLDTLTCQIIAYREKIFNYTMYALDMLTDKLSYNHNRVCLPGWDDQDFKFLSGQTVDSIKQLSPLHIKLLDVAYHSRCATGMIDIPRSLARSGVYNESEDDTMGYAQRLARYLPADEAMTVNGSLYTSHSALFAPWGQYTYVQTSKQNIAPPSFMALMIQRAMILNQSIQYEWALPTSRKQNVKIGKLDYNVPKKLLDEWQKLEGVGVNIITIIPDLGTTLWGNSTLFEVPVASYQALANLSTRYLVNAIEDVVWKVGIGITYRYNNNDAYSAFYAGVTPILDSMVNVGAIEAYRVEVNADINGVDQVNANTLLGKIWITPYGVINEIGIDLIALPAGTDLTQVQF